MCDHQSGECFCGQGSHGKNCESCEKGFFLSSTIYPPTCVHECQGLPKKLVLSLRQLIHLSRKRKDPSQFTLAKWSEVRLFPTPALLPTAHTRHRLPLGDIGGRRLRSTTSGPTSIFLLPRPPRSHPPHRRRGRPLHLRLRPSCILFRSSLAPDSAALPSLPRSGNGDFGTRRRLESEELLSFPPVCALAPPTARQMDVATAPLSNSSCYNGGKDASALLAATRLTLSTPSLLVHTPSRVYLVGLSAGIIHSLAPTNSQEQEVVRAKASLPSRAKLGYVSGQSLVLITSDAADMTVVSLNSGQVSKLRPTIVGRLVFRHSKTVLWELHPESREAGGFFRSVRAMVSTGLGTMAVGRDCGTGRLRLWLQAGPQGWKDVELIHASPIVSAALVIVLDPRRNWLWISETLTTPSRLFFVDLNRGHWDSFPLAASATALPLSVAVFSEDHLIGFPPLGTPWMLDLKETQPAWRQLPLQRIRLGAEPLEEATQGLLWQPKLGAWEQNGEIRAVSEEGLLLRLAFSLTSQSQLPCHYLKSCYACQNFKVFHFYSLSRPPSHFTRNFRRGVFGMKAPAKKTPMDRSSFQTVLQKNRPLFSVQLTAVRTTTTLAAAHLPATVLGISSSAWADNRCGYLSERRGTAGGRCRAGNVITAGAAVGAVENAGRRQSAEVGVGVGVAVRRRTNARLGIILARLSRRSAWTLVRATTATASRATTASASPWLVRRSAPTVVSTDVVPPRVAANVTSVGPGAPAIRRVSATDIPHAPAPPSSPSAPAAATTRPELTANTAEPTSSTSTAQTAPVSPVLSSATATRTAASPSTTAVLAVRDARGTEKDRAAKTARPASSIVARTPVWLARSVDVAVRVAWRMRAGSVGRWWVA